MPIYVNIGGAQKALSTIYANVGGAQKELSAIYANIGGVQKNLLGYKWAKYYGYHIKNFSSASNLHLYADNQIPYYYYTTNNSDGNLDYSYTTFDSNTGIYDIQTRIQGVLASNTNPLTRWQYYLSYGDYTDGKLANNAASADISKMVYRANKDSTFVLDSDSKGGTFGSVRVYSSTVSTTQHGDFIEYVTSNDLGAYPDNGVQGDYWYIRQ